MKWTEEYSEMVIAWKDATTREQYHIYNAISPSIEEVIKITLNKYHYSVGQSTASLWRQECLNHVFLCLSAYNKDINPNPLNYIWQIVHNYLHEKYRKTTVRRTVAAIDYIDDYNNYENCEYDVDEYEDYSARILKYIQSIINKIINKPSKQNKELIILNLIRDFLIKYSNINSSKEDIFAYIAANTNYPMQTIMNYMYKHLNVMPFYGKTIEDVI